MTMTGSCLPRVSIWAPLFAALLALAGPAAALADDAAGETGNVATQVLAAAKMLARENTNLRELVSAFLADVKAA